MGGQFSKMKSGMDYERYRGERYQGWVDPRLRVPPLLLDHPERAAEFPSATTLLDCRGRQILRLQLDFEEGPSACFLYYFRNSSPGRSLRPCYSLRTLRISQKLQEHGFQSLKVVAALKKRGEYLNWHSLLVAREIADSYEIPSGGKHVYQVHPTCEMNADLTVSLARELVRFHQSGFCHGDLKSRHILVKFNSDRSPQFHFVDLEKCLYLPYFPGLLKDILVTRDLVQLRSSLPPSPTGQESEADRFTRYYLEASGRSRKGRERIHKILSLYEPGGPLQQGKTLLASLVLALFRRSSSSS